MELFDYGNEIDDGNAIGCGGNGDDGDEIDCDDGNDKSMFFMRRAIAASAL